MIKTSLAIVAASALMLVPFVIPIALLLAIRKQKIDEIASANNPENVNF